MKRGRAAVGVALLALCAAACAAYPGTSEEGPGQALPRIVPVAEVCGGTLFSPAAGQALERLLASTVFEAARPERDSGAVEVAKAMEVAYRAGGKARNMPNGECEVKSSREGEDLEAHMVFIASRKHESVPDDMQGAALRTGVVGQPRTAGYEIEFDCVSPRAGSTRDVPLRITARFEEDRSRETEDRQSLTQEYRVIAHAAALTVARELRCADGGGLPSRPTALPKSAPPAGAQPSESPRR
ncbi:hypothetical protein [Streptomyces sp. cmx-4-9]|uniref:hypothetical protein n=1 Tax=Streptomyces sp. cmx-4-9 TaxID=2790941 RepID=UPI00397FF65C